MDPNKCCLTGRGYTQDCCACPVLAKRASPKGYVALPETKDTNPKDAIGSRKLLMHLIPWTALSWLALAFLEGALKYGKYNWRVAGVRTSVYLDAIMRHLGKFADGEWADPQTRVPHLASIMACCAIILDARAQGKLTDDRAPASLGTSELIDNLADHADHLRQVFKDHSPHQHTILDNPPKEF